MAKSGIVHIEPTLKGLNISAKLRKLVENDDVRREVHRIFEEECRHFVPIDTGSLQNNVYISKDEVRWSAYGEDGKNYAHYVYEGEIYGPYFYVPIERIDDGDTIDYDENGEWGWRSPRGVKKTPTGRKMKYSNPRATSHWDRTMLARRGNLFKIRVEAYLKKVAKGGKIK